MRSRLAALTAAALLCLWLPPVLADERRLSNGDTARRSAGQARDLPAHPRDLTDSRVRNRIEANSGGTPVPANPAVRQYWSDRCVQQRARGWGHTGDCESPAYHGGGVRKRHRWYRGGWPPKAAPRP